MGEAGVQGNTKMTITWSFGARTSVDGKVNGPGVYGFQDMVAIVANPALAHYTPKTPQSELAEAFKQRWVHSLNNAAPFSYTKSVVDGAYRQYNFVHPWFIGEHGDDKQIRDIITGDLRLSESEASAGGLYMGMSMFQFQQSY